MVPVRVINLSPTPVTLYQNISVGTFSQLEDSALGPVSCNRLVTKKTRRQTRLLASKQFDLDTMNLTSTQKNKLANSLDEFSDIFLSGPEDLGRTGIVKHQIHTGSHPPIKQSLRRVPMHQQETMHKHVEMLQHG